jgi:hypothetical protein
MVVQDLLRRANVRETLDIDARISGLNNADEGQEQPTLSMARR